LILAPLALLTLKEPRRARAPGLVPPDEAEPARPGLREVFIRLWSNTAFRHLLICYSIIYFFGYGQLQWQPTFFMRSYGLTSWEVGAWFAIVCGVIGGVGIWIGGEWACRWAANNERLQLIVMAASFVFYAFLSVILLLVSNHYLAFGLLA